MHRLTVALFAALVLFSHLPAVAETDAADKARIQLLEDQVTQLKAEVRKLRLMTSEMQTRLNQQSSILEGLQQQPQSAAMSPEETDCQQRLADLTQKRDQMLSLGYRPGHPDVKQMTQLLDDAKKECAKEGR